VSAPGEELRTVLPGTAASPRSARRFVAAALATWALDELCDTLALLTSELVTNVVLHVRAECELRVRRLPGAVRVEVRDPSPVAPHRGHQHRDPGTTGRGMVLVDALASDWGVDAGADGKTVWFEVAA
jgi:anti-sigma regulatory factor (Ser/Thr protein kinase)